MDRTLFSPPMIETFRVCRRAYQLAFGREARSEKMHTSTLCKRFLLKALAEINRSRITSLPQVQKYLGQHWPADKLTAADDSAAQARTIQAFRFIYRVLMHYIGAPYRPEGSEAVGVSLKVRARLPHTKSYLEDTFDLILWHPEKQQLELVDFHLHPLKAFDPAWPAPSLLVREFLAERLKTRWPFVKVVHTFCQLQPDAIVPITIELDSAVVRLHWPELLQTVGEMKSEEEFAPHRSSLCKRCHFLNECLAMGNSESPPQDSVCLSA